MPQDFPKARHRVSVRKVASQAWSDIMNNHAMAFSAGLSYYFVLSIFPLLILAATIVGYLPIPDLFEHILSIMSRVVPSDSMVMVRKILRTIIQPGHGALLTFGIVGTIWTASSGFASLIEALNVAYDVPETRAWWKTRLLAVGLTFVEGVLVIVSASLMIVGPRFGEWLANKVHLGPVFVTVWPYLRWGVSVAFVVLAIELLFFWAPNVKQRFWATLPGAAIGVAAWMAMSWLLGLYFRSFANFNKTYGALGAAIALMTWLYWSAFVLLIGAEINSELLKASGAGTLEIREKPPTAVKPRTPWEERERPAA